MPLAAHKSHNAAPWAMVILSLSVLAGPAMAGHSPAGGEQDLRAPEEPDGAEQIFHARDLKGASDVGLEGCAANSGEYTLWVYATAATCGVPREQAEQVVLVRQPLPGVAPLRARVAISGGSYHLWIFGSGDPGHPWLHICGRTCVIGELPAKPGWVSFGPIEVRDLQMIFIRTKEVPYGHTLRLHAMVLSSRAGPPEWSP
ncbi:MAG TPA: hypothetical protein VLA99_14040 [Nitrospiraceae bacterium]|nr:hypothetical protein [Nitrospiraceae bacterium]